jgi:hypothetical protein
MTRGIRIYVAGPLSADPDAHVRTAMDVGSEVIAAGFIPFIPHLYHFLHQHQPQEYETWMTLDFAWLDQCHGLIRIAGYSPGADREVARAKAKGIPVFQSVREIVHHFGGV